MLAAAAYRRWGDEAPARLRGSFSLLLWEPARQRGLLAVDHLGAGGIVHTAVAQPAFATEVRDLLPLLPAAPGPDDETLVRQLVLGSMDPGRTLYAGVRRLPAGHALRLGTDGATVARYWELPPPRPPARGTDAALELRSALDRAVRRRLHGAGGILLSGGLDSATVAGFACFDPDLTAYSATFPDQHAADESTEIERRSELLGLRSVRLAYVGGGTLAATLRHIRSWRLPPASPTLFFHEPLLALARSEGVEVMLDGQGGDELFAASPYLTADRLRRGRLISTVALTRMLLTPDSAASRRAVRVMLREYAVRGAVPAFVEQAHRRRSVSSAPQWLAPAGAAAWADVDPWAWKRRRGPRWRAFLAENATTAREQGGVGDFLRRMTANAGLEGAHPFLHDVDLVETVLALPPEAAFDPVLDRALLRRALHGVLPDSIRLRTEKVYFDDVLAHALRADLPALHLLLGDGALVRRYVRSEFLTELIAGVGTQGPRRNWTLWRCAAVEVWLRQQEGGFAGDAFMRLPVVEAEMRTVA